MALMTLEQVEHLTQLSEAVAVARQHLDQVRQTSPQETMAAVQAFDAADMQWRDALREVQEHSRPTGDSLSQRKRLTNGYEAS